MITNHPKQILKKYWGYEDFRHPQNEIIDCALFGNDVVGVLRTGFGKSICYQVPALMLDGITIVVSPLISLQKDQVDSLNKKGIKAEFLNSSIGKKKQLQIEQNCLSGNVKLLYVSPERIILDNKREFFQALNISLIAHDETHLVDSWSSFRNAYDKLHIVREYYPNIPIIAVTATANRKTTEKICEKLNLTNPTIIKGDFDRKNISIEVHKKGFVQRDIVRLLDEMKINRETGPAIIYSYSKKDSSNLDYFLRTRTDYRSAFYHAGLKNIDRVRVQNDFMNNKLDVIVATEAFAMGIDKDNIRLVVNETIPKSITEYYQRIGRAGRDGEKSRSIVFYSPHDIGKVKWLIRKSNEGKDIDKYRKDIEEFDKMINLCTRIQCRRQMLLNYFEQETDGYCGFCDICDIKK
jgi:ATP-dependent DNA helicase RecQ